MRGRCRAALSPLLIAALLGCGEPDASKSADAQIVPPAVDLTALLRKDEAARPLGDAEVLGLLERQELAELERRLEAVQAGFEAGSVDEASAVGAFRAFRSPDAALLEPLDAWVAASPGSYAAHAARGVFLEESGWRARGAESGRGAPEQLQQKLEGLQRGALEDLRAAVAQRPKLLLGHGEIIRMARASRDRAQATSALEGALAAYPQTYWARALYMQGLQPRWGGSYEEMAAFAQDAQAQLKKNPRLFLLLAAELTERGAAALAASDCEAAIARYSEALRYGPSLEALRGRGRCRALLEQERDAVRDFDAYLLIRPEAPEVLVLRGRIYRKLERIEKAALDFKQAEALEPTEAWVINEIALNHRELGRLEPAVRMYERALVFEPDSRDALEQLVALLPQLGRRADAERLALRLIELQRR